MGGSREASRALRTELVARLRAAAQPTSDDTDPAQRRRHYAVMSEDYRTLALMDELPDHAEGAHAAWRQLVPDAPDMLARGELLTLLADAYAEAAEGV